MVGRFIVVTMWAVCMVASLLISALGIFIAIESVGAYNALVFVVTITLPLAMWMIGREGEKEGDRSYLQSFISFFTGWGQAIRELKARGWHHVGPEPRPVQAQCSRCGELHNLIPLYTNSDGMCLECHSETTLHCAWCGQSFPSKEMYTWNTCDRCSHTVGEDHPSY